MRTTTPAGQPFLSRIQSTYPDLDRWRRRGESPEPPQRHSELAEDDKIFTRHPISELARMSLSFAGEHLRLASDAIEAGSLYPSAHFTVMRGALVGACQGVWILAPDERTSRQQRGLTVLAEMHRQMRKYYRRQASFDLTGAQRDALTEQQNWLTTRDQELARVRTNSETLNLTDDVIPAALDFTYPDTTRRQDGRALWALMGGDAHVLGWSTMTRSDVGTADRTSGLAEATVGGSLKDIAQPFIAAHGLLRVGWSLYDRRGEGS